MSLPPPQGPPVAAPAPHHRRRAAGAAVKLGLVLALLIVVAIAAFKSGHSRSPAGPPATLVRATPSLDTSPPTRRHVRYLTEGTALYGSITYATSSGTGQRSNVDIPLTLKDGTVGLSFDMRPGAFVYLAIQNGTDIGTVTCIIEVDGVVVARNSSSGAYAIAQCDATA